MKRYLMTSDGRWCAAVIEDAEFFDNGVDYAERACITYGLPAGSLVAINKQDGEDDPRTGDIIDVVPEEVVTE
jgi:hypothetical protein